jgi:hypothetical protein
MRLLAIACTRMRSSSSGVSAHQKQMRPAQLCTMNSEICSPVTTLRTNDTACKLYLLLSLQLNRHWLKSAVERLLKNQLNVNVKMDVMVCVLRDHD